MKATFLFLLLVAWVKTYAQELKTGLDVMKAYEERQTVQDQRTVFHLNSISGNGKVQKMKVQNTITNQGNGFYKSFIQFSAPADIKGTGLLTVEQAGREDDQWLYLPALRKTRRIAASNISDQFVGTDMTFEDLRNALSEDLVNYVYKLLPESTVDSAACYTVSAMPDTSLNKIQSGYGKRVIYIRKDVFEIIKTEFYNEKGELFKVYNGSDVRQVPGSDHWRTYKINLENLKTGHKTHIVVERYDINQGQDQDLFTIRNLEKGI